MAIRFDVRGDKTYLRFGEKMRVDAWYTGGSVFFLDCSHLGDDLKVKRLNLQALEIFIDGSYCLSAFVKGNLDTYGFSQCYRRYALQLSVAFYEENDKIFAGDGDELVSDKVQSDRNYLFFSKDGYHRARLGYQAWGATYVDGFVFLYRFEPDGTLIVHRKQLSLFYIIQDTDGRVYHESELEDLFLSVVVTLPDFQWALELMGTYYNADLGGVAILSPTDNRSHCPILKMRYGMLLFSRGETDYFKECVVERGFVFDGYGKVSLFEPFNFVVSPTADFTTWFKTLSRVLAGECNSCHLSHLYSS